MMRARLVVAFLISACGRDPAQVRWDDAFSAARAAASSDPVRAQAALEELAKNAPRAVDEGAARLELARLAIAQGRILEGAQRLRALAEHGRRQDDRARAYYELARLAETTDRRAAAQRLYRALVLTYPNLMPGERALAHLLRMARDEGAAAVDRHLAWTRSLRDTLAHSGLADDLLFQAADESRRQAELSHAPGDWARTEVLFRRLADGPRTPLWNDAWWELSWLYHRQGRYRDELAALRTILRSREQISLFGQDEHPYFWQGQLRIARLYLIELDDPRAAIDAYLGYAELFPLTIKKDDVTFFAWCAALQSGEHARAEALLTTLVNDHPDSRFHRRVAPALADPRGPACLPPEVER